MSSNGTTIWVSSETAERIRQISKREGRQIITTVDKMVDMYEPLTQLDHARLNLLARETGLTVGQVLSDIIQTYGLAQRREEDPCPA